MRNNHTRKNERKDAEGSARKIAVLGMLTALMLVLGYVEHLIPIPGTVPGMKLGLSNTVLLYSVYLFSPWSTLMLMLMKVVLSGLLFGGVSAMMYSFAGGLLSTLGMLALRRVPGVGIVGVSVAGAALHNVGQVLLAILILKTNQLLYYLAVLLLVAMGTGFLTGVAADRVLRLVQGKDGGGRQGRCP